jgi:hypothetical protein
MLDLRVPIMRSKLFISVVVLTTILLGGCATTTSYQAKAVNREDGAFIRCWDTGTFLYWTLIYTEIEKVDGLPLSTGARVGGVLVDPGLRVLSVAGTYGKGVGRDTGKVELDVTLKAGHLYQVKAEYSEERMTLWVEDEATHEVVSEKRSTNTSHWIKWL